MNTKLKNKNNSNYKIKLYITAFLIFISAFFAGCGEGTLDISEAKYEPKIVIDGYIYPDSKIEEIKITRNFPLNQTVDFSKAVIADANVTVTDIALGKTVTLEYNSENFSFEDPYFEIKVEPGKSYRLDVDAVIDGKQLHASSVTTVPLSGLEILDGVTALKYREKDPEGKLKNISLTFRPSEKCDFYAYVVQPERPTNESFIYDNAYFEVTEKDLEENWGRFILEYSWLQNVDPQTPVFTQKIEWHQIWFYGGYYVTIYAGDRNFRDYVMSNNFVQEPDGNFHEPKLHIDGDGIGVFGSAIRRVFHFSVYKN